MLTLNRNSPNLSLPSSFNYRTDPLVPSTQPASFNMDQIYLLKDSGRPMDVTGHDKLYYVIYITEGKTNNDRK
jgi:hypothetical protein